MDSLCRNKKRRVLWIIFLFLFLAKKIFIIFCANFTTKLTFSWKISKFICKKVTFERVYIYSTCCAKWTFLCLVIILFYFVSLNIANKSKKKKRRIKSKSFFYFIFISSRGNDDGFLLVLKENRIKVSKHGKRAGLWSAQYARAQNHTGQEQDSGAHTNHCRAAFARGQRKTARICSTGKKQLIHRIRSIIYHHGGKIFGENKATFYVWSNIK